MATPAAGFLSAYYEEFYLARHPEDPMVNERVEAMLSGELVPDDRPPPEHSSAAAVGGGARRGGASWENRRGNNGRGRVEGERERNARGRRAQ